MGVPFGVLSWLWVMAHINCLYGKTFAKPSGRLGVTRGPYPWKRGSNKFLQQRRGDCSASDWALPVALVRLLKHCTSLFKCDWLKDLGVETAVSDFNLQSAW